MDTFFRLCGWEEGSVPPEGGEAPPAPAPEKQPSPQAAEISRSSTHTATVLCVRATGLRNADFGPDKSDPYVVVSRTTREPLLPHRLPLTFNACVSGHLGYGQRKV